MMTNFSKVVFTDETRVILDGPDGWSKGWNANGCASSSRFRRPQGGEVIMIWAGIIYGIMVGQWGVSDRRNTNYC